MKIKGNTIQEHIWNSMEELSEEPYSVWNWVELFEHFKIPVKGNKDYNGWVKQLKKEGRILSP